MTVPDVPDERNPHKRELSLLPQQLADLRRSGLADEQIRACGIYSAADPAEIARLLRWARCAAALAPCLAFPYLGADGRPTGYVRVKPDRPRRDKRGKPVKYESPRGVASGSGE